VKIRIYYHHTDCGKVVYYANYLKFLEEARTEFFEQRGVMIKDLAEKGTLFVVARQEIDYKFPAFYGDVLDIDARLTSVGGAKIEFANEIKNQDNKTVALAKTTMVCVGKDLKPKSISDDIRGKLK
jgi:acyl-CoA thioester hydrolase